MESEGDLRCPNQLPRVGLCSDRHVYDLQLHHVTFPDNNGVDRNSIPDSTFLRRILDTVCQTLPRWIYFCEVRRTNLRGCRENQDAQQGAPSNR